MRMRKMTGVAPLVAGLAMLTLTTAPAWATDHPPTAERLVGPPVVSCWSWAIADADTGQILWGSDIDVPHKSASITKMMCATVILDLAKKDPSILDETVT